MIDFIVTKISALFAPKYVGSLVRTLLGVISGWLISLGIPSDQIAVFTSAAEPVLIGVATALVTLIWSFIQKKKS